MKVVSLVLVCLVALSIVSGCIAISVCYADNPKPYYGKVYGCYGIFAFPAE